MGVQHQWLLGIVRGTAAAVCALEPRSAVQAMGIESRLLSCEFNPVLAAVCLCCQAVPCNQGATKESFVEQGLLSCLS